MLLPDAPTNSPTRNLFTRRNFLRASAAGLVGTALYSNQISRHELEITHPTFFIKNLPPAFDGFRIAQISDIHLEEYTEDFFLEHIVAHINHLAPDLVLVTGDFISNGPLSHTIAIAAARRCAQILAKLQCPLRYGVLGNHDYAVDPIWVRTQMESYGLPILVNQFAQIQRGPHAIAICGLDDAGFSSPNILLATPQDPAIPTIVMVHEPDFADNLNASPDNRRVDLLLSGHTHGGQIILPGLKPLQLPPDGKHYPHGHYTLPNLQLYVNRGLGTVGIPFRFNCPPEITLATLRPAPTVKPLPISS